MSNTKMYIAVHDSFPDYMTPTLVAHAVCTATIRQYSRKRMQDVLRMDQSVYDYTNLWHEWQLESFKKVVVKVDDKSFTKIMQLDNVIIAHENKTFDAQAACAVLVVRENAVPSVLAWAKLWKPAEVAVNVHDQIYKG